MARGVLCPKCATVAPANALACPKCGTQLSLEPAFSATAHSLKRPKSRGPSSTLEEGDGQQVNTSPHDALSHESEATMMDLDLVDDDPGSTQGEASERPTTKQPPRAPVAQPRRNSSGVRAIGPVPAQNTPIPRKSVVTNPPLSAAAQSAAASMARKDPLIGEKLGEYLVEEKIGVGGMGIVYRARQPLIGTNVAIKVLSGDVSSDKRDIERLLDEARVVNAIKHRGIINIFGAGELADGRQYLVMEYLEGETLEKRLETTGQLSTEEAIPILDQVLAALAAAHGTGIVHRDLKPANVFLVKQSDGPAWVKLLDFGLARPQMQEVSRIAGTPDYISPEHARGRPAGAPADLYGFGVLAFHLLTGQLPFKGNSPMEMMEQHVHSQPPVPTEINPSIPSAMSGLILALLEKDPSKRPDATGARNDLRAAAKQLQKMGVPNSTPRDGLMAMTAMGSQELDPRLKVLSRKGGSKVLLRTLASNWPWVLAGLALIWLVAVVLWMTLSKPTAAPVPPSPLRTGVPVKVEPGKVEPGKVEPVKVEPEKVEPEKVEPVKPVKTGPAAEKARERQAEIELQKWQLDISNKIAQLNTWLDDPRLGDLFRPASNAILDDSRKAVTPEKQHEIEARLKKLKADLDLARDRLE